jgi:hypothetical protein
MKFMIMFCLVFLLSQMSNVVHAVVVNSKELKPLDPKVQLSLEKHQAAYKTVVGIYSAIVRDVGGAGGDGPMPAGLTVTLGCKGADGQYHQQTWSGSTFGLLTDVGDMCDWVHSVDCQGGVDAAWR